MTGGAGINIFKSAFEFKTISRLLLSMGISLAMVDHFIRATRASWFCFQGVFCGAEECERG
jgi:hypothetical protein